MHFNVIECVNMPEYWTCVAWDDLPIQCSDKLWLSNQLHAYWMDNFLLFTKIKYSSTVIHKQPTWHTKCWCVEF